MEFSAKEQKMIRWLKLQQSHWHSTRVITLVGSLFVLLLAIFAIASGKSIFGGIALLGMSIYGLSYTLGNWSGRPEISLLLKLIREKESNDQ